MRWFFMIVFHRFRNYGEGPSLYSEFKISGLQLFLIKLIEGLFVEPACLWSEQHRVFLISAEACEHTWFKDVFIIPMAEVINSLMVSQISINWIAVFWTNPEGLSYNIFTTSTRFSSAKCIIQHIPGWWVECKIECQDRSTTKLHHLWNIDRKWSWPYVCYVICSFFLRCFNLP